MKQVALALQKAHEQGIVHRDIKPENILVTRKVEVKVTDFGLSRFFTAQGPATNLTQSGVTLGTPLYMSPEQVQGHPVDNRSDIYSFGVTCYHLLAGEPPFRGTSAFDVALKHVQEQPRPLCDLRPDLPPELCGMIHKMMAKNPDDRYQTAKEVTRDLAKVPSGRAAASGTLVQTPGPRRPAPAGGASDATSDAALSLSPAEAPEAGPGPAPVRRRWLLVGLACLLATAGGVCVYAGFHPPPDPPAPPAATPAAGPGLPDVRPPDKLTTTRERELLAVLNTEGSKPDDVLRASVELGLLYVKEHRLPDATDRFEKLRLRGADSRDQGAARSANLAARLGQAVVLAHKNEAEPSNKLVMDVVTDAPKFGPGGPKGDRSATLSWLLLRYPDLSSAVSDALNRNAANLGKAKLDPPALEQLRSPHRAAKKD